MLRLRPLQPVRLPPPLNLFFQRRSHINRPSSLHQPLVLRAFRRLEGLDRWSGPACRRIPFEVLSILWATCLTFQLALACALRRFFTTYLLPPSSTVFQDGVCIFPADPTARTHFLVAHSLAPRICCIVCRECCALSVIRVSSRFFVLQRDASPPPPLLPNQ